jgi:hypothetical protein
MTASSHCGHHPAPDPLIAAPAPPAARHQPLAAGRWREGHQESVQSLSDRLLPHRYRRVPLRTEEGKFYLCVAIDRTSKFAFARLHAKANRKPPRLFEASIEAVPYKIHTILTDNGV